MTSFSRMQKLAGLKEQDDDIEFDLEKLPKQGLYKIDTEFSVEDIEVPFNDVYTLGTLIDPKALYKETIKFLEAESGQTVLTEERLDANKKYVGLKVKDLTTGAIGTVTNRAGSIVSIETEDGKVVKSSDIEILDTDSNKAVQKSFNAQYKTVIKFTQEHFKKFVGNLTKAINDSNVSFSEVYEHGTILVDDPEFEDEEYCNEWVQENLEPYLGFPLNTWKLSESDEVTEKEFYYDAIGGFIVPFNVEIPCTELFYMKDPDEKEWELMSEDEIEVDFDDVDLDYIEQFFNVTENYTEDDIPGFFEYVDRKYYSIEITDLETNQTVYQSSDSYS